MYSGATPSGSIAAFSLYCRYLAMDVAITASWSLLSNQDCISNILASFTGSPSASLVGECGNFKKILRTRKIMVMHSNERGECCLRTLVDRSRKRYINTVDVVVRLHDPTDPSTERTAPPSSAHVQLDDVLAFSIQQDEQSSR